MGDTAKVFMSGGSQAVRLPAEYRVDGKELRIRKEGNALILEPMDADEWAWLHELAPVDESFLKIMKARPRPAAQSRTGLSRVFK